MKRCTKCHVPYCSREHQIADWKAGHKFECALVAGARGTPATGDSDATSSSATAIEILTSKMVEIRLYVIPFVVCKRDCMGSRGFVYVRSPNATLDTLALRNERGDDRDVVVEYFLVEEFDALALENQFELVSLRPALVKTVDEEEAKPARKRDVVVLLLLSDGYAAVFTYPVVPDEGIARSLGLQYQFDAEDKRELVLKLDSGE